MKVMIFRSWSVLHPIWLDCDPTEMRAQYYYHYEIYSTSIVETNNNNFQED